MRRTTARQWCEGDPLISVRLLQEPVKSLTQPYTRDEGDQLQDVPRHDGTAHEHVEQHPCPQMPKATSRFSIRNFVPTRDPSFNWTKLSTARTPPPTGRACCRLTRVRTCSIRRTADSEHQQLAVPAAGPNSPKAANYPKYMENGTENPRGIHAVRVLNGKTDFTIDSPMAAVFDNGAARIRRVLVPTLPSAYDATSASDPQRRSLAEPIAQLRSWDRRWSVASVPTTLAVFWEKRCGSVNPKLVRPA